MKPLCTVRSFAGLVIASGLLLSQPVFGSGRSNPLPADTSTAVTAEDPAKKETKKFASLNNIAVKIHPATVKREMHVVAKENEGAEVDFYVFDLQGTLIQHYKMQPKSHYKLSGLKKGQYVYSVFQGDEETVSGKFEIR